jgi:hypothetical protein
MNTPRLVFIIILVLSLFITAKSFVAVRNVDEWSDDLRHMFTMELGNVGKRSYPIEYYMRRIEAIQREWKLMRYVSVASSVLSCLGIYLVSKHEKRVTARSA